MLVWLLPGLWALAGLAHLLHRWDRRHGRDFLTAYLRTLAVLDVWRGTTFALAATTSGVLLNLPFGALALTPRLISPVILLSTLMIYAAQGTSQATLLIMNLFASGLVWGVAIPFVVGVAVALGWVPIPGGVAGLLFLGSGARLAELLALMVGVYAAIVVHQFLANRRLPRWASGTLGLLAGGIVQTVLFALGALAGRTGWVEALAGEIGGSVVSTAAILPVAIISLFWVGRRVRGGETEAGGRPALSVLRETFDLRRSLAESRQTVSRLSQTLSILTDARHLIVQAVDPDRLMQDVCTLLVSSRRYRFAWIGLKREGDHVVFPAAQAGAGQDYLESVTITWDEAATGRGPMGSAIRDNRAHVVADTRTDEQFEVWRGEAVPRGYLSVIGLPMRTGDEVVGGMAVYADTAGAFADDEIELLQGVADDLAHGLGRLRAERLNALRLHQLDILRAMTQDMISLRDLPRLQERMLQRAVELIDGSSGGLYLSDAERRVLRGTAGFHLPIDIHGVELQYGDGAAGRAAEIGQGLIVPDYRSWPNRSSVYAPEAPVHAVLAAPMLWQGEVIGVIDILRDERRMPFTPGDLDLLQLFANQAALVLENARLIDGGRQRVEQLSLLHELTLAAIGAESRPDFIEVLTRRMPELLKADSCMITRWDALRGVPSHEGARGSMLEAISQLRAQPGERTLTASALEAGKPLAIERVAESDLLSPRLAAAFPTPSVLVVPLVVGARRYGAAFLGFDQPHVFTQEEIALGEQAGALVALAVARLQAIEAEKHRSATLSALRQASLAVTSRLELNAVLESVLEHALQLFSGDDGHIFLYNGERLSFGAARWADAKQHEPYSAPRPDGLTMRVARGGKRIVVPSVDEDPLYQGWHWGGAIVGLPLRVGVQVLGVMNLAFHQPRRFADAELDDLQLLADQAALALQNASLFAQVDAERQRLSLLVDLGRELASSVEPGTILEQAVNMTTRSLGGRSGSAFLVDPGSKSLLLAASCRADGLPTENLAQRLEMRPGHGLEAWVAEGRQACRVDDVRSDERWVRIPGVDEAGGSAISAPLLVGDRLLGVMTILADAVFTQSHLELLEAICRQVALALSNAGRFDELERRFREQVVVQQVAQVISRRLEMQPLLEEVCQQVAEVLRYPNVEIMLVEGGDLVMRAAQGAEHAIGVHVPLSRGIVGRVTRTDRTSLVPDIRLDPDYVVAIATTRSEIVVPLHKGNVVIGVLNVESPVLRGLTEDDARLLSLLGDQVSVAIENAALYDRLRRHSADLEQTVAERTARLAEALEQAKEADRLKTQFVADVSHELRTPLTNIRLYLELIGQANRERFAEYLETLNRETERLVDLIEDLLAISRLDAGTHPPQPAALNLNELARGLVADRKRLFDERRLEVTFLPDDQLPSVMADERMLSQVVANLMTNAMHYTLPGGRVSIGTEVTVDDGARWVTLRVSDTGLGIPVDEVDHVFERFYRGTASRRMGTPGTGLGLSICKEILGRHKGRISVHSRVGEGSTFTIWLPHP